MKIRVFLFIKIKLSKISKTEIEIGPSVGTIVIDNTFRSTEYEMYITSQVITPGNGSSYVEKLPTTVSAVRMVKVSSTEG